MDIIKDRIDEAFPLPLEGVYIGAGQWRLTKPFKYVRPPIIVEVPVGFITDGASIPQFAWSFIGSPWSGKYTKATVPHDYGYHSQTRTRKEVDGIFLRGMQILGVSWLKRWIMYRCIRWVAWICWDIRKKQKEVI